MKLKKLFCFTAVLTIVLLSEGAYPQSCPSPYQQCLNEATDDYNTNHESCSEDYDIGTTAYNLCIDSANDIYDQDVAFCNNLYGN